MRAGTPAHRDLFCGWFIDTHTTYEPESLPWPELDGLSLERLRAFPLWSYARSIEQRAGRMVSAFAQTLEDPVIRKAVGTQAIEETRHGRLMSHVCDRYGIDVPDLALSDPPARAEDFRIFGFGECTDSFIGFGAFSIVRQKRLFPEALLTIFDTLLWEEARHVVFFINWWRYELALSGRDGPVQRVLESVKYHARALAGAGQVGANVPTLPDLSGAEIKALLAGITPVMVLEAALAENRRHMARCDRRLITPKLMPTVATALLLGLRMLPPRRELAAIAAAPAPGADQTLATMRSRSAA